MRCHHSKALEENFKKSGGSFKEFKIGDLFEIGSTKKKYDANKTVIYDTKVNNSYPYITRTEKNNGLRGYIIEEQNNLNKGNVLTFAQDTFLSFYQKEDFFTGNNVKILKPNFTLNEKIALYLTTEINRKVINYSWGVNSNINFINNITITLPILKSGDIAYSYIEERIRELEQERIRELDAYLKTSGLLDYTLSKQDEQILSCKKEYKEFKIGNLFEIYTGRDIIIGRTEDGDIPLISHQHENNGITKYIQIIKDRRYFNHNKTLAVADRGVFLATTQNKDFQIGTRVKAIVFKNGEQSENVRLFFVSQINKLQILFKEYLENATDSLPELPLSLPITSSGEIDYDYIENYIKALKKTVIKSVILWKEKQIEVTKSVI